MTIRPTQWRRRSQWTLVYIISRCEIKIHFCRVIRSFYARWLHSSHTSGRVWIWIIHNTAIIFIRSRDATLGAALRRNAILPRDISLFRFYPPRASAWMAGCKVTLTRHFECTLIKRAEVGSCRRRYFPAAAFTIMVQTPRCRELPPTNRVLSKISCGNFDPAAREVQRGPINIKFNRASP